jgi:hypothetical protein
VDTDGITHRDGLLADMLRAMWPSRVAQDC